MTFGKKSLLFALHSGFQRHLRLELYVCLVSKELEPGCKVDFSCKEIDNLYGNRVRSTALIPRNAYADGDDDDDKKEEFKWSTL